MSKNIASFARLSFGNVIEWYDFSLYIYFAIFIARDFFPSNDQYVAMLLTFATFFLGSVVRPVGGFIGGVLADKYHPKRMINISVILMGLSTILVAALPSYSSIGILAPLFLVALRIIQGLAVGGQFPGLISLSVQDYNKNKGFTVGVMFSISSLGFLLASLAGLASTNYFTDETSQLVWRVPFALSGVLFMLYIYLNRNESYDYTQVVKKDNTLLPGLLKQYKAIIAVVCLTTMAASLYYIVFTYLINYQVTELGVAENSAFLINSLTLVIACALYPLFGYFADIIGAKKLFYIAGILFFISSIPLISLIQSENPIWIFIAIVIFTALMAAIQGAISPLFAEVFEPQWRTTGCALSYSIGNGLSGAAPLVALTMVHYNPVYGLSACVMLLLLIGTVGFALIRQVKHEKQVLAYPVTV